MLPSIYIVGALGFSWVFSKIKKVELRGWLVGGFLALVGLFAINYFYNYIFIYPKQYSFAWQYGYRQVASYIEKNQDRYQRVIITKKYGEPHEFILFYMRYDPREYKSDPNLVRYNRSNWYWVDRFNKYEFMNDWEIRTKTRDNANTLLITSPGNYPVNGKLIQTVNFLNGERAFDIVEINPAIALRQTK